MKIVFVFTVCLFGSYADILEDIKQLEEETKKIEEYRRPCLQEVGLYSESANGIGNPVSSPTIGQIFCLWACLYRKNGSIQKNGAVNETAVRLKNPDLDGPLDIIIIKCEHEAKGNTCKLAGCLAEAHFKLE